MSAQAWIVALALGTLVAACGREEEKPATGRTPIVETRLRTPKGTTRVREALVAHTPKASDADEPIVHDRPASTKVATALPAAAAPTLAAPPATAAPAPAAAAPVPEPTAMRARKGVVLRGVELATAPNGNVLGEFQGRTDVEVLEDRDGWSRVRTQVIDGGSIEGWIRSASLADPAAKPVASKPAPKASAAKAETAAPKEPAPKAAASAPKPAAAKAAKRGGDRGPVDVLLVPIAGTEKKRPATPFTHKAHADDYSIACETCHHPVKAKGGAVPSYTCSAAGCHTASECNGAAVGKKNADCPNFEDAFHTQCIACHKKDGGPTKCAECHSG